MDETMRMTIEHDGRSVETTLEDMQEATRLLERAAASGEESDRFEDAPEVAAVARDLIEEIEEHHHLAEARIRYIWRKGGWASKGRTVFGKAIVLDEQKRFLVGADLLVIMNEEAWGAATPEQREAMVDHELCHFAPVDHDDGSRTWTSARHDLEEFHAVVRRHGLWDEDLQRVMQAYRMHEADRHQVHLFEDEPTKAPPELGEGPQAEPAEEFTAEVIPPALVHEHDEWEGTCLPLYRSQRSLTSDELADAAWDQRIPECIIRAVRTTTRGDREITQQVLYRWLPQERRVQRVPQHSVQTLIRELGGEDQEERRATG